MSIITRPGFRVAKCGHEYATDAQQGRQRLYGDCDCKPKRPAKRILGPCVVDECPRKEKVRKMCTLHYSRWLRTGDVGDPASKKKCRFCEMEMPLYESSGRSSSRKYCDDRCKDNFRILRRVYRSESDLDALSPFQKLSELNVYENKKCRHCGVAFNPDKTLGQVYCSDKCSRRYNKVNNPNPCSEDGCEKPHLARGLCSMHYKRQARNEGRWNEKKLVECVVCGTEVERSGGGGRKNGAVCSLRCRYFLTWGKYPPSTDLVGPVPKMFGPQPFPVGYVNPFLPKSSETSRVFVQGACHWCGCSFTAVARGWDLPRYCSDKCKIRRANSRYKKFSVPDKVRSAIYQRDSWLCQLCFEPTSRVYSHDDLFSPTLDHIVPQSRGGSDEPENLRLAHMICNSERGVGEFDLAA